MAMHILLALALLQSEEATSVHYRVVSTYADAKYVRAIADRLEAGHPQISKFLGLEGKDRETYTVRLYATPKEYLDKDLELNAGRFANNGAFSHRSTKESYILVQPRARVPLFDRTNALICHEAFHILTYRHAEWLPSSPDWLNEGMAEYAAELCIGFDNIKYGNATAIVRAQLDAGSAIPLSSILQEGQSASPDFLVRRAWYAESWLLVKFLSETRAEAWAAFLRRLRDSSSRSANKTQALLLDCVDLDLEGLEKAWTAWVRGRKHAKWMLLDGDWRLTDDGVEGAAFPESSSILTTSEAVSAERFVFSAEVRIEAEGSGQADLVFVPAKDLRGTNLWKVCVTRTPGTAALLVKKGDQWKRVASKAYPRKNLAADRWVRLEVEVDGRDVDFRVDGATILEHTFDREVELHDIRWGVGGYDSWTRFRSLKFESR